MSKASIITGGIHTDERGTIMHVNDLDMEEICRMYHFHQEDTDVIRAWQGHRREQKWMHCIKGSYAVRLVHIGADVTQPSHELVVESYTLTAGQSQVLHIPEGYANGFKAIEKGSILMVFSNMNVEDSGTDLTRYAADYWQTNWNK